MKLLWHWFVLLISFALAFAWDQSDFDRYTVIILTLLAIVFVVIVFSNKKRKKELIEGWPDIFIINTSVLLLITITGNLYSPLYFLLYFLGFGITFIFEPLSVFIYVLCAIAFFIPQALKNGSIESFIRLGSLILISPLAFFFGQEYRDRDKDEQDLEKMAERSNDAGETIKQNVNEVLQKESLKKESKEKLKEVLNEAKDLEMEGKE